MQRAIYKFFQGPLKHMVSAFYMIITIDEYTIPGKVGIVNDLSTRYSPHYPNMVAKVIDVGSTTFGHFDKSLRKVVFDTGDRRIALLEFKPLFNSPAMNLLEISVDLGKGEDREAESMDLEEYTSQVAEVMAHRSVVIVDYPVDRSDDAENFFQDNGLVPH